MAKLKYKEEITIELWDLVDNEENEIALTPKENNIKKITITNDDIIDKKIKLELSKFKNLEEFRFDHSDQYPVPISVDLNGLAKLKILDSPDLPSSIFLNLDKISSS